MFLEYKFDLGEKGEKYEKNLVHPITHNFYTLF